MEGFINHKTKVGAHKAPLEGRYHDGPQRCFIGLDTAGMPIYSGTKIPYGNCSGALEVFYGQAVPYYQALMKDPLEPLTVRATMIAAAAAGVVAAVAMGSRGRGFNGGGEGGKGRWCGVGCAIGGGGGSGGGWSCFCGGGGGGSGGGTRNAQALPCTRSHMPSCYQRPPPQVATVEDGTDSSKKLLADVHASLMSFHADTLKAKGFNPETLAPPKAVVLANWIADGKYTPGIGSLWDGALPATDKEKARARKPAPAYDVYVVDQVRRRGRVAGGGDGGPLHAGGSFHASPTLIRNV